MSMTIQSANDSPRVRTTIADRTDTGKLYAINKDYKDALLGLGMAGLTIRTAEPYRVNEGDGESGPSGRERLHEIANCLGAIAFYDEDTNKEKELAIKDTAQAILKLCTPDTIPGFSATIQEVAKGTHKSLPIEKSVGLFRELPKKEWRYLTSDLAVLANCFDNEYERTVMINETARCLDAIALYVNGEEGEKESAITETLKAVVETCTPDTVSGFAFAIEQVAKGAQTGPTVVKSADLFRKLPRKEWPYLASDLAVLTNWFGSSYDTAMVINKAVDAIDKIGIGSTRAVMGFAFSMHKALGGDHINHITDAMTLLGEYATEENADRLADKFVKIAKADQTDGMRKLKEDLRGMAPGHVERAVYFALLKAHARRLA